ncbi:MAG: luciferase family protein [Actinomycetia bacterium]|jgi:alkanesulfonate monooxygenase SsuD/methylene tetrahydromethanopterin reductase-like flavin-dependent oxidoreductase (luciferase family)|nr:luciferase family protein [Actinomycetes bacterium]
MNLAARPRVPDVRDDVVDPIRPVSRRRATHTDALCPIDIAAVREPRVSVSRSVVPITSDLDRRLFGADTNEDEVGWLDGAISRFGRTYTGEPDRIADELAKDAAVQAADTILLTVPSQLGVDYNAAMLETIARDIAPAIGWNPKTLLEPAATSS